MDPEITQGTEKKRKKIISLILVQYPRYFCLLLQLGLYFVFLKLFFVFILVFPLSICPPLYKIIAKVFILLGIFLNTLDAPV